MFDSTAPTRVLALLRDATRTRHADLDAAVNISTLEQYGRFLVGSFAAVSGVEPAIDVELGRAGTERTTAIAADLHELGLTPPSTTALSLLSRDAALGAAYVMEGSSLGGMVLAARVEGFTSATRYLRLRGKDTATHWRQFLETLERDVTDRDACLEAACQTFDHYSRAFRLHGVLT